MLRQKTCQLESFWQLKKKIIIKIIFQIFVIWKKRQSHIQNISINKIYEIDFKHNVQQKFHN